MSTEVTILRDLGAAESLGAEWDSLVAATGADIYFARPWVRTWWRHFGARRRPLIAVVREGDELLGLLAFAVETLRPAGIPVRVARLSGPNPNYAILRLPLREGREAEILVAVLERMAREECDAISLSPLSESSIHWNAVCTSIETSGELRLHPGSKVRQHTQIPLPGSFDGYMACLSRNRRQKYRRSKRMIEEERRIRTRVLKGADAAEFFDSFVKLHNDQFKTRNRLGHFDDWPSSRDFYAGACRELAETGEARLYVQEDPAGSLKSALLCFVSGRICHAHLTARDEDPELASADFGLYAQIERIERLIAEGVEVVESGAGEYEYKLSLKGETLPMMRVLISGTSIVARSRVALLVRWADVLDLVYYRAWFLKAAPRLRPYGLARNSLWQEWIRTRL